MGRGLRRRPWLGNRPAWLISNVRRRPQIVDETQAAAKFAEGRDLERIRRTTDPGTRDRANSHQLGVLLDRAGLQAREFGLGPPRFTLGGLKKSAAAACQRDKDEGADEIQANSARHPRNFDQFI
jgi:hypothetical protein